MERIARMGEAIHIGREGELNAAQIKFNISKWIAEFGSDGKVELIIEQNGTIPPPIEDISQEEDWVTWNVSNAYTQKAGTGTCQLLYLKGETLVAKSPIYDIVVTKSIGGTNSEAPEGSSGWVIEVINAAESAKSFAEAAGQSATKAAGSAATAAEEAEKAINAKDHPPIIGDENGNDTEYWYTWHYGDQVYKNSGKKVRFSIVKVFYSVEEMNADTECKTGDFVIVTSPYDDKQAVLYVKDGDWHKVTDLTGYEGIGIATIQRTSGNGAEGTADTYTITYTDGKTETFQIYNGADGNSITEIKLLSEGAPGAYDEYTINYSKSEPSTFKIYHAQDGYTPVKGVDYVDGKDAISPTVEVTSTAAGHQVTITDKNGTETFEVYNGKDGEGKGDMLASSYDPNNVVVGAGGIEEYVKNTATKITYKSWTAADAT